MLIFAVKRQQKKVFCSRNCRKLMTIADVQHLDALYDSNAWRHSIARPLLFSRLSTFTLKNFNFTLTALMNALVCGNSVFAE